MISAQCPNAVTCPQCRSQLQVLIRDADRGRCPLCSREFAIPAVLELPRTDDLPRLIPVRTGFLQGDFIWNAGLIGGLALVGFGLLWWAIGAKIGFSVQWAAIPIGLGIAVIGRALWRTIRSVVR